MSEFKPLPLLAGTITYSEAIEDETDILRKLSYPEKRLDFYQFLQTHTNDIETIVSHHLGVSRDTCRVPWVDEWVHGSFNVCIPIYVRGRRTIAIRFPLPYKIGEATHQGNVEEKLRCEVATYAWMQAHCPYVMHPHRQNFSSGYMVMDYVDNGSMLSASWHIVNNDVNKRLALYQGISRVMLGMAQVPLHRIGSLTIDDYAVVSLTNRPLGLHLHHLENDEITTGIPRNLTYATTDTYLMDRLACHDNRLRSQPNSIIDRADGASQMSTLTIMRALMPHFTLKKRKHGPFLLMLTDLHPSNIFVDVDGHVTCVIDLEWACALPVEMFQPPYWLTSKAIDEIVDDNLLEYAERHREFISVFRAEEEACGSVTTYSEMMRKSWELGGFWYFNAIDSLSGFYNLFLQHIQPRYGPEAVQSWKEFERSVTPYWTSGTTKFIDQKIQEREHYLQRLREVFQRSSSIE